MTITEYPATYEMTDSSWATDEQKELTALMNDFTELQESGKQLEAIELAGHIDFFLDSYLMSDELAARSSPETVAAMLKASWAFAKGNYDEALKLDSEALNHARSEPFRSQHTEESKLLESLAYSNISIIQRRLGNPEAAVDAALKAIDANRHDALNHVELALSYCASGAVDEANQIFEQLAGVPDYNNPHDALAVAFAYEKEIHALDLPGAKQIVNSLKEGNLL